MDLRQGRGTQHRQERCYETHAGERTHGASSPCEGPLRFITWLQSAAHSKCIRGGVILLGYNIRVQQGGSLGEAVVALPLRHQRPLTAQRGAVLRQPLYREKAAQTEEGVGNQSDAGGTVLCRQPSSPAAQRISVAAQGATLK